MICLQQGTLHARECIAWRSEPLSHCRMPSWSITVPEAPAKLLMVEERVRVPETSNARCEDSELEILALSDLA